MPKPTSIERIIQVSSRTDVSVVVPVDGGFDVINVYGGEPVGCRRVSLFGSGNIEKPRQRRWSSVIDLELALERIARGRVAFLAVARRLI